MIDYCGLPQGVEISNLHLRGIVHNASRDEILGLFARSFEGIRTGVIATDIAAVYSFADIAGALAWNAANSGKVLLRAEGEATGGESSSTWF